MSKDQENETETRTEDCAQCGENYEVVRCPGQCTHCGHSGDCG